MKIFCINGIALAGKDSFAGRVCAYPKIHGKIISTIDPIKNIYKSFFGWDGNKTEQDRKNLNTLKNIWVEVCDGPIKWTRFEIRKAEYSRVNCLFVMVREFEEMSKIQRLGIAMGFPTYSLEVTRDGLPIPPIEQEFLDSHPKEYKYAISIHNPTVETFPVLPQLDIAVKGFVEEYLYDHK